MTKEIAIKVENVSKIYKLYEKNIDRLKETLSITNKQYHIPYYALNNISFNVQKGETVGIIGTNGSGKSTLLKLITGVATPSTGQILVNGKVSALLELGAGFNPEYTGMQNIYLNGTMMGYNDIEIKSKIRAILEFADIGDFIYQPVKTYSSGMFARLAFAVAINVEPEILIVDEALSVGDVFFQNKCYKKFEELREKNTTILFVSHDVESIKQMCTKVLWIEKGRQMMFGDKIEVCNEYTNSILRRNGSHIDESIEGRNKEQYELYELEVEKYPPITYSNESILSEDVEIVSCFIEDSKGLRTNELFVDKEYSVNIIFKSKICISRCIAGFVLETSKGMWVINSNSIICDQKKNFEVKQDSIVKIEFKFVLPKIMKGEYVLGVAISDGIEKEFKVLSWLYNVMSIRVINNGQNSALIDVDTKVCIFKKEKH